MKTPLTIVFSALVLIFSSACEKCADCSCTGSYVFDFDDAIPTETQQTIEEAYISKFPADDSEEICGKKKDLELDTAAYVLKSDSAFTRTYKYGQDINYTVTFNYPCKCVEKK
ncbi:MAG: hypothetical protein R2813_09290 [Flavobacteriales bacterium]